MSDIERVFGPIYCVWLLACSYSLPRATPVSSGTGLYVESLSLVLLLWNWFERLSSRSFPGCWDGLWSLDGSCSFRFSPAPSSLPSLHSYPLLSYIPRIHIIFFPCQRLGHPASGLWRCLFLYRRSRWRRRCGILRCLFRVWTYFGPLLVGGSHTAPCIPKSNINPIPHDSTHRNRQQEQGKIQSTPPTAKVMTRSQSRAKRKRNS